MADSRELADKAFSLLQDALSESEARAAELDAELKKQRAPRNELEARSDTLEQQLKSAEAERDGLQQQAAQLQEVLDTERAKIAQLKKRLDVAESGPDKTDKKEINFWRARSEKFDEETRKYKQRIAELRKELNARQEGGAEEIDRLESALMERDAALEKALADIRERDAKIETIESTIAGNSEKLERQLTELTAELADKSRLLGERDQRIADLIESQRLAETGMQSAREQIAGLEEELSEEKECAANLREIANERHEEITKLTESLEEAQERYEEAKWQLECASRFERLVARRRKLIDSLIAGLRARQKSNNALKAGLDGLRRFKAKSELEQQKMLVRIDELTRSLRETEQQLSQTRKSETNQDNEQLRQASERISELEERLNSQVDVIESLESELNTAKATTRPADNYDIEIAELKAAIEARNQTIKQLQTDLGFQQEQLAKLRGSESETMRLETVQEEDQSLIDELRAEIASLKAELEEQQAQFAANSEDTAAVSASAIRKHESLMGDLKRTIRDQEKEIARLNEAVAGWQKKYEFLSTDAPAAYQSAGAEK